MKVTVWTDYGCEGWSPEDFPDEASAVKSIMGGYKTGTIRVTTDLDLVLLKAVPS